MDEYAIKFKAFIEMCQEAKQTGVNHVIVHHPEVLGDTYAELVESLNRLADAGLMLMILPQNKRG